MHYPVSKNCLSGKKIIVTGATSGIGRQAALSYAEHGAQVLLIGRDKDKLHQVAEEIASNHASQAECYQLDFAQATVADCQALAKQIASQHEQIDGLLHNAGVLGNIMPLAETPAEQWSEVMKVNVEIGLYLSQALLPLLAKAPEASLVFTSSGVGRTGRAGWGAYAVSKFATEGMMQVFAADYADTSVRVNCINPGRTRTPMRASAAPSEDPMILKTAKEIMPLYLWLMSAESREMTGNSFDAQP